MADFDRGQGCFQNIITKWKPGQCFHGNIHDGQSAGAATVSIMPQPYDMTMLRPFSHKPQKTAIHVN